jgi:hypothetical protein
VEQFASLDLTDIRSIESETGGGAKSSTDYPMLD